MKAYDYIKNKLENLIDIFPQMKVSYEFEKLSNSHFIEILPSKEFRENLKYSKYETNLIMDFITMYPNEDIVFVTENDLIEVNNPSYIKKGVLYDKDTLFWNSNIWSNNSISNFSLKSKKFPKSIINSIDLANIGFGSFNSDVIIVSPIKEEPIDITVNDDEFALAA